MKSLPGLGLGALCAVAIACGAAKRPMSAAPPGAMDATPATAGDARGQIDALDAEIRAELTRLGLPAPAPSAPSAPCGPDCAQRMSSQISLPSADATCKPAASDTCRDTCTLAESICESAGKICNLAGQLGDDAWANGKCADGKTSCDAAKQRCCECL